MKKKRGSKRHVGKQKSRVRATPVAPVTQVPEELQETLEVLRTEGEVDSEGQFTIAADKVAQKLGAFQLPTLQSWLLVLVQAANRGKATKVKIRQSAKASTVEIHGLPKWDWSRLTPYLAELNDDGSFLTSLAVAFRALGALPGGHRFKITTPAGICVRYDGDEWTQESAPLLGRWLSSCTTVTFEHLNDQTKELAFWPRRRAAQVVQTDLLAAVRDAAFASPVPIVIDGWRINNVFPEEGRHRFVVEEGTWQEKRFLALLPVEARESPGIVFPLPRQWSLGLRRSHEIPKAKRSLSPSPGGWSALGVLCLHLEVKVRVEGSSSRRSQSLDTERWKTHWVKDGVIVGTGTLGRKSPLAMTVFLCADGLPTDLTGLRLRRCPERTQRRRELSKRLHEQVLELVASSQDGVKVAKLWSHWATIAAAGCVFAGGLVTLGGAAGVGMSLLSGSGLTAVAHLHDLHGPNRELARAVKAEWKQLPEHSRDALGG